MEPVLNQFVYFGFFQAILLLFVLALSNKHRQQANAYLVILTIVLLIGLCGRVFYAANLFGASFRWIGLSEFSILFFGPTVYLFTCSLLENKRLSFADAIHYLPGLCYSVVVFFYYMLPEAELIRQRVLSGELFRVVRILAGIALVVDAAYFVLSVNKYLAFRQKLRNELSYNVRLRFLRNFLLAIGLCLFIWLVIYLWSCFFLENLEIQVRAFVWTALALIVLFITYYHMINPEVLQYENLLNDGKYAQSKFSVAELDILKLELADIMEHKKPYLNKKLLKAELAELLGISNPEMARLLNERIGMNFFEFINYYRIQEFIQLAKTEEAKDYTFFALAQRAGFNSKATFNKSFKNMMGCSPTHYLNKNTADKE